MVSAADAGPLAQLLTEQRRFLAATDPVRPAAYYTEAGQLAEIEAALTGYAERTILPCVIEVDGVLAGRITVSQIVYRAFCSGTLGYWVRQDHNGRGVASAAAALAIEHVFGDWGLHRLQAGTLVDNIGSQRVLARNGFTEIGLAPRYLRINGAWRDHILYQRLNEPPTEEE